MYQPLLDKTINLGLVDTGPQERDYSARGCFDFVVLQDVEMFLLVGYRLFYNWESYL